MDLYCPSRRVSHFATKRPDWVLSTLFSVCSPAGGELARCEAARWRSRTEGVADSYSAFFDPLSGSPLRPAAAAAVHLPQHSLRSRGEETFSVSRQAGEHREFVAGATQILQD